MQGQPIVRHGFTLVEVLVAVFLVGGALLALEGSAAVLMRALADGGRELVAARLVQGRTDRIAAGACVAGSGSDSVGGVVATWSAAPAGGVAVVTQSTRYVSATGVRSEAYHTVVPCR